MSRIHLIHKTLLLTLLLLTAAAGFAQNEQGAEDVLYLRNGTVLRGHLLQYVQGGQIVFQLKTGDRLVFTDKHVRRLVQGGEQPAGVREPRPYSFREKGFYATLQGGMAVGRSFTSQQSGAWNVSLTAGHLLRRTLGFGVGVGADAYFPDNGEIVYPVFAEVRGYLLKERSTPYYALRSGYGFAFKEENQAGIVDAEGGLYLNPAIGARWGASGGLKFTTEVGFQYQRAVYTKGFTPFGEGRDIQRHQYKRLNIRLGMLF